MRPGVILLIQNALGLLLNGRNSNMTKDIVSASLIGKIVVNVNKSGLLLAIDGSPNHETSSPNGTLLSDTACRALYDDRYVATYKENLLLSENQ